MKLRYLLFLLISGCLSLFKANAQIDSLENQLNNCQIDSVKLQLLTDLNWLYLSSNLTRAKQCAEDELLLAQKSGMTCALFPVKQACKYSNQTKNRA